MYHLIYSLAIILLGLINLIFAQVNEEHIVWNKQPLSITLPIGQERLIVFPTRVEVDASDAQLTKQQLRITNNDSVLYLLAKKPFKAQRLFVRTLDGSKTILLDISAQAQASHTTLNIIWPTDDEAINVTKPKTLLSLTQLMRWAVQQFFAPERLLTAPSNIHRVAMHSTTMVRLLPGQPVIAHPVASWQHEAHYITAVKVRNTSQDLVKLDHCQLLGKWQTALFYPAMVLAPYQSPGDTTMLFLISKRPFVDSLGGINPCVQIDY